jgi:hypothetical protein
MKMGRPTEPAHSIRRPRYSHNPVPENVRKAQAKPDQHNHWGQYAYINHGNASFRHLRRVRRNPPSLILREQLRRRRPPQRRCYTA